MAINVEELNAALEQLETQKGISREVVVEALKEAMTKSFKKDLGDEDAIVEVVIDFDKGIIEMYQIKTVVEEVEDDLLEISLEDANKKGGKYKVGDQFKVAADIQNLRKAIVLSIKSIMKQKFAEVEKGILYEQYRDKIGTMITGRVEAFDEKGASINIGKASVYMQRKEMIKDERFAIGDTIKIYVVDVATSSKGAHIIVSRAHEGFLRALMTEEIHDIYDGTIVIKSIAREAGERSKVAVYCEDPNIDPAGTCIGPNGSRIQKVVSQLGNGSSKEKIDIITYSSNSALYIMDALKPARAVGISVNDEEKTSLVVVKDDSLSLAIGRKGVNARLAAKLTGYKIDIKIESEAIEEGLEYMSQEEVNALELEERANRVAQAQRESLVYQNGSLPGVPEGYVAPQERNYEEETNDFDSALEEQADKEEVSGVVSKEEDVEEQVEEPVEDVNKETQEVEEQVEEPASEEKEVEVKTTTTIEDLEKSLESESKSKKNTNTRKKKKNDDNQGDETSTVTKTEGPRMSIYTEEELKEFEEEEEEYDDTDDEDIDYDEYDQYYDEN